MLQGSCRIYPERVLGDIDPLVFGHFIEFTHDCIDQGMWAELLRNRGFEEIREGEGTGAWWRQSGYNDTGLYRLEQDTAFGHGFSQRIQNIHHFGGYKGIEQRGLLLQKGCGYRFAFWARGCGAGSVKVRLKAHGGSILWQMRFKLAAVWQKYEAEGIVTEGAEDAVLEFLLEREGGVLLDQCSLMPENAPGGIWKEVFRAAKELRPAMLRFPGGCFADCYAWEDGIGERDRRPARPNAHWGGMEENNFGTDEFIELCRNLDCEPMICVNFGSAGEEEAARWVEYCNGDETTPMGRRRAQNGHPQPYRVIYWGIGNETWADWEIGNLTAERCAEKFLRFARAMRAASPEPLSLVICGGDGNLDSQEWNRQVLQAAGEEAQYIDLHFYAPQLYEEPADPRRIYDAAVYAAHKYEKILKDTAAVIERTARDTRIMVGEYNAMYYNDSNREQTLEAALLNGAFLNLFLRNAGTVRIGIFSDLVNGWQGGCIRSERGEVYRTPSYYVLRMYAEAGPAFSIETETDCGTTDITGTGHVPAMNGLPVADCQAAADEEGTIWLFAINRHPEEAMQLKIEAEGYEAAAVRALEGKHAYSINTFGQEPVSPADRMPQSEKEVTLAPHSVTRIRLQKREVHCAESKDEH